MSTQTMDRSADPDITAGGMIGVIWMETVLALACVIFRLWIRKSGPRSQDRKFGADDLWVVFAFVLLLLMSILHTIMLPILYMIYEIVDGKRAPTLDFIGKATLFLKIEFAIILLFWTCIWAVKAAFLTLYRGLFTNVHGWQRSAWWAVAALCVLSYIGNWVLQFLACTPLSNYFVPGLCQSDRDIHVSNISLYYSTAVDAVCDFLIMVLPLSILWELRLSKRKKVALGGLFTSGLVIIAFAIIRLVLTLPGRHNHVNPKWLALMSSTEACIAVMVSCAPPLKVLLTRRQNSAAAIRSSSYRGTGSSSGTEGKGKSNDASRGMSLDMMGSRDETPASRGTSKTFESTEEMMAYPATTV